MRSLQTITESSWKQPVGVPRVSESPNSGIPLDASQPTWDVLAGRLDALIQRWEANPDPPALSECLPTGSESLRRLVLVELIKVDLDYRWTNHKPRTLE